jgi:hypothetical protein
VEQSATSGGFLCLTIDVIPISDVPYRLLSNNRNISTIPWQKEVEIYGSPHDVVPHAKGFDQIELAAKLFFQASPNLLR